MSEELGVKTRRDENFSDWYLEVVRKGDFIDQRSPIKGCDVILPWGYAIWEEIQRLFDDMIKKNGVKNCYFPLFIPERLIKKEEEHFKGFKAETAMVTEIGNDKLEEKLAVRPTSETIMYYMFSLWIRSYKDLPFKINQWCNIVRWDTKVTKPFIRGREFLWQEGHTAHATREDALNQVKESINVYKKMYEHFAMGALILKRPKSDTFAGADFSIVFDSIVQDGKVIQGPDCHMLGQNFSKPFRIKFLDKGGKEQNVWQTSWGLSTRQLGALIMHHGDDKGAILPPSLAPYQVVIIPIPFKGKEKIISESVRGVEAKLKEYGLRVHYDDRDYSPGFKFNDWELRGVPLRIEIGPKDVEKKEVTVARRDGKKEALKINEMEKIKKILNEIQSQMLEKSKKFLKDNIRDVRDMTELKKSIKFGFSRASLCNSPECEKKINEVGEIRGTLFEKEEKPFSNCIVCGKPAKEVIYIAKAY